MNTFNWNREFQETKNTLHNQNVKQDRSGRKQTKITKNPLFKNEDVPKKSKDLFGLSAFQRKKRDPKFFHFIPAALSSGKK